MTTEQERLARLEANQENQERRIEKLENNQRWGVLTILGLLIKTIMDILGVKV